MENIYCYLFVKKFVEKYKISYVSVVVAGQEN